MITREQVADLRPGDVVELADDRWPGVVTRGPLTKDRHGCIVLGRMPVRLDDGSLSTAFSPITRSHVTLTVVSRAPRPLYVNHDRAEPVPGDVVRDADDERKAATWSYLHDDEDTGENWRLTSASRGHRGYKARDELPARLRLLVDGTTGRCVP